MIPAPYSLNPGEVLTTFGEACAAGWEVKDVDLVDNTVVWAHPDPFRAPADLPVVARSAA